MWKQAEEDFNGSSYSVVSTSYPDVIHVLVHKNNIISKMFRCPLLPQPGGVITEMVAMLEPEPLVGTSSEDISGRLYTEMIGSLILKQNSDETRTLVLGLGNIGPRTNAEITKLHREELLHVIKLVQQTAVW